MTIHQVIPCEIRLRSHAHYVILIRIVILIKTINSKQNVSKLFGKAKVNKKPKRALNQLEDINQNGVHFIQPRIGLFGTKDYTGIGEHHRYRARQV